MEDTKLAARIRPLEEFAERNPRLYRFRVALLASLGYAYLLFVVILLLGIVVVTLVYGSFNYVTFKILWIPLVLVGLVLRSLWLTIPEPDGKELRREDAPSLFDLIGEVSSKLRGPKVHHVLVSDEFNASIVQIPQFGMLGWLRNYLVVGLPLLRALSPAEFRSVLAHEFGHLSGKHGQFSGWVYRVRQTWIQVLVTVHQERRYASFLFEPFLKWYAPYLNAYSFVLARTQEREADTYSVELAGKDVAALALTRLMTKERRVTENFWPDFFRGAKEQPLAPKDPFARMLDGLDQSIGYAKAQRWFMEALRVPTGYDDTHPALVDRLAAMGFQKDTPQIATIVEAVVKADEIKESAADHYLRELPEDFLPSMNRLLRERIAPSWRERHEELKKARKRLEQLAEEAKTRALTTDEQWEKVRLISEDETPAATVPLIREILKEDPNHIGANFALGALLIEEQNAEGIEYLEKAMQLRVALTGDANQLLSGYYFERGDKELAEAFRVRAEEFYEKERRQHEQATNFTVNDQFLPHGLSDEAVQTLREQAAKVRGLASVYLVRKVIEGSDEPVFVLGITVHYTWRDGRHDKHLEPIFEGLLAIPNLPSPMTCILLDGEHAFLFDRIFRIAGSQIFATPDAGITYRH